LVGFLNVLEGCRKVGSKHLLYASSSSVYGANTSVPWQANKIADHPLSLYGASKRANELMAHAYAHLFGVPMTGLRFFTVYGPWGRPDMAYWVFTDAILHGRPIKLFNNGNMRRDFTYIDDVIEAITRLIKRPAKPDPDWLGDAPNPASSSAPWRIYNIGNSRPIALMDFVRVIEKAVGRPASCEFLPMQPGDVVETSADCTDLERAIGFRPQTPIDSGIRRFVEWFRSFHELS
jgi:UDP-glucuronate 4-epimerase